MKKFILRCCTLGVLTTACMAALFWISAYGSPGAKQFTEKLFDCEACFEASDGPKEIRPYIEKVQTQDGTTGIILGDSVCCGLYNELQEINPSLTIVGSNQAVSMVGQYLLLKAYLEHHPDATDAWIIARPDSLYADPSYSLGYSYLAIPFTKAGLTDCLSEDTVDDLKAMFGQPMLSPKICDFMEESVIGRLSYLTFINSKYYKKRDSMDHSGMRYLVRIAELCDENGISLHVLPAPLPDTEYSHEEVMKLQEKFRESGMMPYIDQYVAHVVYYDEELFRDGIHIRWKYEPEMCEQMVTLMYPGDSLHEVLKIHS